ncbi:hypothetical protein WJ972_13405 [Achromobacter insuavis]
MKEVMDDAAAFYGLDDKHNRQVLEQIASELPAPTFSNSRVP